MLGDGGGGDARDDLAGDLAARPLRDARAGCNVPVASVDPRRCHDQSQRAAEIEISSLFALFIFLSFLHFSFLLPFFCFTKILTYIPFFSSSFCVLCFPSSTFLSSLPSFLSFVPYIS